jgi:hypothetical protein
MAYALKRRRGVGQSGGPEPVPLNTIVPVNTPCPAGSKSTIFTGTNPNVQMCIQPCSAGSMHNAYLPGVEQPDGSFTPLPFGTSLEVFCWAPQPCTFIQNGNSCQSETDMPQHEGQVGACLPPSCPADTTASAGQASCPPGQISQPISGDCCGGTQCVPSTGATAITSGGTSITSTSNSTLTDLSALVSGTTLGFPTWAVIAAAGAAVLLFMSMSKK